MKEDKGRQASAGKKKRGRPKGVTNANRPAHWKPVGRPRRANGKTGGKKKK